MPIRIPIIIGLTLTMFAATAEESSMHAGKSWDFDHHGPLRVDADQRRLEHADGTPFLWLADTAWELFHRLDRAEVEMYLEKRRAQGFTVIQAVALAELNGLNTPNAYGSRPLVGNDPSRLWVTEGNDPTDPQQYDYWDHVDYVFDVAAAKGIAIALVLTWGDKIPQVGTVPTWGSGPRVFTAANARAYGQALAQRYGHRPNLIWINGGDRKGILNLEVWNALAAGVTDVDQHRHLMTYHPCGGFSSRDWFVNESWHSLVMIQTGHERDSTVWSWIANEWAAAPARPVINGEPTYEAIPLGFNIANGLANDLDTRKYAYWSLFAGAAGHTYGCHPVWQFYAPGRNLEFGGDPALYWKSIDGKSGAIDLPGAWSVLHLRRLLLSRPMTGRVPDPTLLLDAPSAAAEHQVATRAGDSSWAMLYTPAGLPITVDLGRLGRQRLHSWWYDPRLGTSREIAIHLRPQDGVFKHRFVPPQVEQTARPINSTVGHDWVLVIDDDERGFPPPGRP